MAMEIVKPHTQNSPMDIIKFNLERQNEQGKALVEVINRVEAIADDVDGKFSEMSVMVQEVRDSVTLTYQEQMELQSAVFKASVELAKDSLDEGEELSQKEFSKLVGSFRRGMWKKLKAKMDVPRYAAIRRVDFDEALEYVNSLSMREFLNL